jgi:hypothetical protein
LIDNEELPDSISTLTRYVSEAVSEVAEEADTASKYMLISQTLASVTMAAFHYTAMALGADDWQMSHAQSMFLHSTDLPTSMFRTVYAHDVLVPGMVEAQFTALDEWYTNIEKTVMPSRAKALLDAWGDDVDAETKEHWKAIANRHN